LKIKNLEKRIESLEKNLDKHYFTVKDIVAIVFISFLVSVAFSTFIANDNMKAGLKDVPHRECWNETFKETFKTEYPETTELFVNTNEIDGKKYHRTKGICNDYECIFEWQREVCEFK